MNWVIIGQGAMGLLWYHYLNQLNQLNQQQLADNKPNALSLLPSKQQDLKQKHYQFTAITDQQNQPYNGKINYARIEQLNNADTVFLCLKSYQIGEAIAQIATHLKAHCNIVLAHNGMGTLEALPKSFIKSHAIYALLTTHGCLRNAPLNITHTGKGISNLGLLSGKKDKTIQQQLTDTLNSALPTVTFEDNIAYKQWQKLAINCVINPITAINNIDNGLVNGSKFTQQIQRLLAEVVAVAKTQGITFQQTILEETVQQVAQATAKNCSSMRCDVLASRRTEVDYINGYIHRLGEVHGIATPENTKMWQAVKSLTR